ncbi:MAG: wax ester/triacylglycerol synthase family O-acyltransferase [Desulfobacteraceae bacterium]|nr:wax ester/triacylglycerol synthase family O-acyltransferase [Desulfobacteraceae bacterium]MBC2755050.1 wax ester/triacylglycerol synthase family O-acyltransferase [Desulfobacteraceae bacterium]
MAETMTNADNFWLHMDHPTNLMVITGIMEFKEIIDYDQACLTLENRLCAFDRFKQRVVMPLSGVGVASWEVDPFFDIRSHFHRVALPGAGGKQELQRMVSDLMTIPMDRTKPLWSCHLIENYKKGCALFFRLHHCIADGVALVYVILSTTDKEPGGTPLFENKRSKKKKKWSPPSFIPMGQLLTSVSGVIDKTQVVGGKMIEEWSKLISKPAHVKKLAKTTSRLSVDTATVLGKLAMMPSDPKTSLRGKLKVRKCVAWTNLISLNKVKIVSKAVNATINDVLIASVTGALRRYLIDRGDRTKETELRAAIPVNIREPGTAFELGNKFSLVFLALPVYIEDPILRLREVKKRMDHLKESPDAFVAFMVLSALGISSASIAKTASNFFANKASTVMTNVPGPREPLYFAGKKIENFIGWVPRTGRVGMGISIFSYAGKVGIGLVTDEGLVPDPDTILKNFEEEFDFLFDIAKTGKVDIQPLVEEGRGRAAAKSVKPGKKKTLPKKEKAGAKVASPKKPGICIAQTKSGRPCKNKSAPGSKYCNVHQALAKR